ncbi:hypothetical protein [Kaarinaea lacus]
MSALQLRWINYHFAHGKISREEFASLRKRVAQPDQAQGTAGVQQRKVLRLHRQTRRVLAQIRVFKSVAKLATYFLLLAAMSAAYIVTDHYRNTGSLADINLAVFENYFTQAVQEPLPSDIKQAAQYLTEKSNWNDQHVSQFMTLWQSLDETRQQQYQQQGWFQSFSLALSLHIADQRALIKKGDKSAIKRQLTLVKLAEVIDRGAV